MAADVIAPTVDRIIPLVQRAKKSAHIILGNRCNLTVTINNVSFKRETFVTECIKSTTSRIADLTAAQEAEGLGCRSMDIGKWNRKGGIPFQF